MEEQIIITIHSCFAFALLLFISVKETPKERRDFFLLEYSENFLWNKNKIVFNNDVINKREFALFVGFLELLLFTFFVYLNEERKKLGAVPLMGPWEELSARRREGEGGWEGEREFSLWLHLLCSLLQLIRIPTLLASYSNPSMFG